jgi:hypothetical protein
MASSTISADRRPTQAVVGNGALGMFLVPDTQIADRLSDPLPGPRRGSDHGT